MKFLAVPVPLFNSEMTVMAYSFRFQKGNGMLLSMNNGADFGDSFDTPLLNLINETGLEALTVGKPIFAPISHISLLIDLEEKCGVEPEKLIFVIDKNFEVDAAYLDRMSRFKELGYKFAAYSKMDWTYHAPALKLCDYAFIDVKAELHKMRKYLKSLNRGMSIIVSDIESANSFRNVRYDSFELFEGPFYRLPLSVGQNTVNPLKANYIQLINIVRDENFELSQVAKIVGRDTALAVSLFKLVNSLGLSQKIKSITHASAMLGQKELRKWITTAVTKMLSSDKPGEITKLSLIRAKFAENLAPSFEMAIHAESLFLTGLFSILNVILDMPMVSALSVIQVSDPIRDALLFKRGDFYKVLEFITYYEMADWINVSRTMILNNLETQRVCDAYLQALSWYSEMIAVAEGDIDGGEKL